VGIKIPCPHCGPRDHSEFAFGGERRPDAASDPDDDFERVYLRRNALGRQEERWFHALGCRRWLTVARDTETNRIEPGPS
jgi:heterotetrameric sarcosine oxidase delta subunit